MLKELRQRNYPRIAWPLWLCIAALMGLGVISIYSATQGNPDINTTKTLTKQIIGYILGLGAAGFICLIDYKLASRWALVFYWGCMVLLVMVLFIGVVRWGARRWFAIGPIAFQPSELAKLAFIFALANFLSRPLPELKWSGIFFKSIGMILIPFVLILVEPDLGSALVFIPVGLVMMYVAGISSKYLLRLTGGAAILVVLLIVEILFVPPKWQHIHLQEYQKRRLMTYFGVDYARFAETEKERRRLRTEQRQNSYNVDQALISVGSGGLWGKGWRQGTQYSLGYLPPGVAHNDFIFSVIAEEHGFIGSLVVLLLYTVILLTGIWIAGQARDRLGRLLAVGVVTLWLSHVFINIGMNIRLMPVTGLPLPLLSYGGSSVLGSLIAMGMLQNVYLYRRAY